MGYVSRDIAVITEPKVLTLAALPNFITFASKPAIKSTYQASIQINVLRTTPDAEEVTEFRVTEPSGIVHIFRGTLDPIQAGGSVFYISTDPANTAENMREALLNNTWVAANFEVRVPFTWVGVTPVNGMAVSIVSKGSGPDYAIGLNAPNNTGNIAYTITISGFNINTDSISNTTTEIELDVYTDPSIFLGQDDRPVSLSQIGNLAISLQKTYAGAPVWFELNSLFKNLAGFTLPPSAPGWFNTGTVRVYRFVAKKKGVDSFAFYQSSVLFVINGYGPASEPIDLSDYTYGHGTFKVLTNKPRTTYIRGQKAFLNFIFSDPQRGVSSAENYTLLVSYRVFSSSGEFLGVVYNHARQRTALSIVNTCVLDIDAVLDIYPKAGIVCVGLARGGAILTNEIEYEVRPECLHKLTQFVFLNRLGGWDAFNFDATADDEIKPELETYRKTITPSFKKGDSIETVYTTKLENTITVEGAPVTNEVADWLKELAAARVILDGEGKYIVVDDFKVKISSESDNMQVPTIKYHLSETFTNE